MSSFELQIVEISGLGTRAGKDERPPVETKGKVGSSLVPAKFTLPSEIAIRKGIRNPLDLQSPKLPKLYSEPTNTLNQYARVDDAAHLRPSDRIGRNYTATSKMLTVDAINKSINPTRATSSDNPFSKADLQSIHVPEVLDPLAIPLRPGKGNNTMAPSPKRSNRSIYNSKQWQPELHGALTNSVGESKDTEGKTDADLDAKTNLRNFREAIDNESASQIMPIKKAWVLHCLSKVRKYQSAPGSQNILVACLQEIKDTYLQAVRTAIVNYKILSPRGARRALVDKNVLDELENWQPEQSRWNLHLTHQWRVLRETGIEEKSILDSKEKIWSIFNTLGSAMGRLQQLWLSRVGGIRLCDNRFTNFEHDIEFQRSLPLRMPEFSQRLLQEVTRVRSALKTSWLVASGFILTQHLKYYKEALHFNLFGSNANGNAGRTMAEMQREEKEMHAAEEVSLRSANVLMSRQLREIVEASINDLVQFIQKKRERKLSAITLNVLVSDAPIGADAKSLFELSPSINDILRSMEKCVDDIMDADKNFPSIELLVRPKADPKQPFLQACRVQLTDYVVEQAKGHLRTMIEDERATVEGSLDVLHQFADLFNGVEEEKCSKLLDTAIKATAPGSTKRILEKLDKEVTRYFALATKARNTLQPSAILPIFMVDCRDIISEIATRAENYADRLLETVVNKNRMQMKTVCDEFDKMQQMLLSNPEDSAKLQELQDYWAKCDDVMARLQKIIHAEIYAMTKFIFMHGQVDQSENGAHMYNDDTRLLIKVLEWPQKIKEFFEASKRMQDQRRDDLLGVLKLRKDTFTEETKEIDRKLTKLINQQDYSTDSVHSSLEMVTSLQDSLTEAFFEAERINAQENELQIDEGATDYEETLKKMRSKVEPLQQLWTLVGEYSSAMDQWMNNPLNTVDAEAADTTADNLRRGILKLKKQFDRMQIKQASSVAASISVELKTFLQDMIPLMTLICTPGLRDRHWDDINTITGLDIERNEGMSLFDLTPFHLEHYTDQIEETCVTAVKEFSLEKALINMEAEWDSINFTCKSYRETGTYILSEIDEVQQLLDDQVVKIQAMRSSRFIRPFASRASAWEKLLRNIEEIIENWLKVQGTWLYLEPIFSSDDIQKQMPAENERFKVVDGTWRESMSATAANPKVTDVAKTEGLVERLKEANVLLELIQKGLNDYLETKRLFFPRFFFLSNDELLEILAETKDPRRVQPHLKKCFEGINKLTFDEDLNILGMTSKEGEVVDFEYEQYNHRVVNPNDARGLVEQWLLDVETVMRKAVAYATDCSMEVYEKSVRTTWLKENPGMVVLATAMKVWTHDVEKALPEGTLQDVYDKMQSNLMDVVDMVRSKIPKIVRKAVGALCVIDVHNQSVVSTMIEENVRSPVEFTWLSQMRYYWNQGGPSATTGDPGSLECKMITSTILYAYEYLGLSMRLVITPLTDRCYRTMMGAIALNFGGAPEGPAGTGKTETVKDLAKTLAMLCVVFNCSDGLDFRAMAKFFKGLASAGAWACFDEFNRIELEVLSVVAQQILTIQRAKLAGQHEFFFEGTHLGLRHTANVYITMNPGYAGRSDLPDNLKALFRTVAMMVPDYGMIAEIMLYSMGYEKGKSLSVKIVQCYKLCSEQLSSQKHYDYGMRAVMAVLRAAANLKLADSSRALDTGEPTTDEDVLMLRAILDVNLAKFLSHDIPLFNGIVSDLFPGVTIPSMDRGNMDKAIRCGCVDLGLQPSAPFVKKVMQIYEMLVVRHGFMIVGLPFAGKTSGWKVLRLMLLYLHKWFPEDKRWCNVYPVVINPKSVTMGQLYGQFDAVTHEWTDGIIPIYYRNCAVNKVTAPGLPPPEDSDRKWVLFDGPVDAIWIENMNTVLDDNKKLCLMSGEIIAMTDPMSMMFEPMDLEVASPATVSRCGMIYMEPHELGWRPLLESWFEVFVEEDEENYEQEWAKLGQESEDGATPNPNNRAFILSPNEKLHIEFLFEWLVDPLLAYNRKKLKEVSPTLDQFLVQGLLRNLECLLDNFVWYKLDVEQKERCAQPQKMTDLKVLEGLFMYSIVWSLGSSCDEAGRILFDSFFRRIISEGTNFIEKDFPSVGRNLIARGYQAPEKASGYKLLIPFPADTVVYSYVLNPAGSAFIQWTDTLQKTQIAPDAQFSDIIVDTPDTASFYYNLQLLVFHSKPVLVCGVTGTGKSAYTMKLLSGLDRTKFQSIEVGMSAKTTCNQVQFIIDSKMDKRRKGVYGPPLGMKAVIFIDDFNMPEVEEYGAQPPVELVRQLLVNSGWYDLDEKSRPFRTIQDATVVAAMGPAGGGRNNITPRMLRHFSLISTPEFSHETMIRIFTTISDWYFTGSGRKFASTVANVARSIVPATLKMFIIAREKLLPTPAKSHYVFNLRDMARVMQGVTMVEPYKEFDGNCLARLWMHECCRVFGDRLVDDADQDMFTNELASILKSSFGLVASTLCKALVPAGEEFGTRTLRSLFFGDFLDPEASQTIYSEINDLNALSISVNTYLEEYNSMTRNKMDLVMFQFAIEHLARIIRVIKMPGGNYLLVGVGGSGRQSLTRLAASIADYDVFQIEISKTYGKTEWHEDLKKVLRGAGHSGKQWVFLFSDAQIKNEGFVEDINNILNSGEVPNIFPPDEKGEIVDSVRKYAKEEFGKIADDMSPQDMYNYFVKRIKKNLHVVLAFSPIGDGFRQRMRKFPSLINNCTIDWFREWPSDALVAVAEKFLSQIKFDSKEIEAACVKLCSEFHNDTRALSAQFLKQLRRNNYVTPTSYLELIKAYQLSLAKCRKVILEKKTRYEVGLEKLAFAAANVKDMQKQLTDLQPVLAKSQKETDKLMKEIEEKLPGVQAQQEQVAKEAAAAQKEADVCAAMKADCEADLAEAIPILNSAIASLNTLKPKDINEVKSLAKPPAGVRLVLEAVCVMCGVKPDMIKDPEGGTKKVKDFWPPSKKLLGTNGFLQSLINYDKDNINEKIINNIRNHYCTNPDFTPEKAEKSSLACAGLCRWTLAMEAYDRVAKVVAPKKAKLAESEAELAIVMGELGQKQAALAKVEGEFQGLKDSFDAANTRKAELEAEVKLCGEKLIRAQQLIESLGGEKDRWSQYALDLGELYIKQTGNVLISAGIMAYLGPFTSEYRERIISQWVQRCIDYGVPCSDEVSLTATLGDSVLIRDWNIQGLPTDSFSVDNGIIVFNARRWPLMIDPQGQANKWVRKMEADNGLNIIKLSDASYLRTLENAIQFGQPVLLENIGETLDPSLEPLLLKQVFKQGGVMQIRLGDANIEYSDQFRFYMTTKLRNPHYLPEVAVKVTLLNFMITPGGLEDQLLGVVVREERPELEKQKNELILESAKNNRILKEVEDKILFILKSSSGNILEDSAAIEALKESKVIANDIAAKQVIAAETEATIDGVRKGYKPVAFRAQLLFFCISDLANIEPVYQYSLDWFVNLFILAIENSAKSKNLGQRLGALNDYFTFSLYVNICRSLLEKDKLLFSFLLCKKIMEGAGELESATFYFLLTGGVAVPGIKPNPTTWLSDKSWGELCRLSDLSSYTGLSDHFANNLEAWKVLYDRSDAQNQPLPAPWHEKLQPFERLCVLRCIRADKVVLAIQDFVVHKLGKQFVEPPPFDLKSCYDDSSVIAPLIFILSPGSDPMASLLKFANDRKVKFASISLGQGQGERAEQMITTGRQNGTWVVLQNCHLAVSWMPDLERIVEGISKDNTDGKFRLWLTTYPSDQFPVTILQNGVKMTNEPPKGLKANLMGSYTQDPISDPEFFDSVTDSKMAVNFRKLVYALCFFHAIIQERLKFGALGWNIPYEYNNSDRRISVQQLSIFLNSTEEGTSIPFAALQYCFGECNYGGRVTDDKDRRCLLVILNRFYNNGMLEDGASLSTSGDYVVPEDGTYQQYIKQIGELPLTTDPEVFGMHDNANITKDQNETNKMFSSILLTQASTGGGSSGDGKSQDEVVNEVATSLLDRLPENFDIEQAQLKFPISWGQSMNTVLVQELQRFNGLLDRIRSTCTTLKKAIAGQVVMSDELEKMGNSVFFGKVPELWRQKSYPSLKPLAGYYSDFLLRIEFLDKWFNTQMPPVFWLSGFFFTQAFLTGVLQNFARKYTVPIDQVIYDFEVMREANYEKAPEDGAYITGLFFDCARWDMENFVLADPLPKVLFSPAPIVWLKPKQEDENKKQGVYNCPIYKTSDRRGVLATTGHSSNFVMWMDIPTNKPQEIWIERGVALLTTLDD